MEVSDYISSAKTFAEKAAKLSQKVSMGLVENAKEFGFPGGDSSAQYFDTSEEKLRNIKRQLDSKNDREKLDGLKRLIAMISKGRDVSEFFPDVVKNVVSQNIEIRKLVYIFLLRYAEQEPDLALLSINSFQKDLSDKNQIIRAMALRVMSGIRVPVISPIVLLGIKKCVTDPSPYVRKTAAHAIPKCYSLDDSQKEALIEVIATLLKDRSSIVIGSTIMAFNEVCPNRFDLIHPCYRKLCSMLGDCDEWGQMSILGVLLRYGRSQFLNPNPNGEDVSRSAPKQKTTNSSNNYKSFYSSSSSEEDDEDGQKVDDIIDLDPDHELLLKSCTPLLQSRNSGVVLAVAKLFYYLAPAIDALKIEKPLVRLLRTHRELAYVVLTNIATMALKRPYLFESSLQHFFTQSNEPVFIRDTKLDILTTIATKDNIHTLLQELQQYIKSPNKDFVAATIQAIGRCASTVPTAADQCLRLLLKLLHSKNELVVAESVLVLTRLLHTPLESRQKPVIALMKLLDTVKAPKARANIYWLMGQYAEMLPKVGPDVIRQAAKNFVQEENVTKLQILTLSVKLVCLNPTHTILNRINQYLLNLARYDTDYDVRDRARFLRALTIPENSNNQLSDGLLQIRQNLKKILLSPYKTTVSTEATPLFDAAAASEYTIGSLSLLANQPLPGYEPIPDFPEGEQPDSTVRDVEELEGWSGSRTTVVESGFGSDNYRDSRGRYPSTALSGVEAMGSSSLYSPSMYKKGKNNDYDLDAFYDESSDEDAEEVASTEEESDEDETTTDEDVSEEEEEEEEEGSSEEEYTSNSDEEESSESDGSQRYSVSKRK
ncbi:adaptin N terminal region-domain-containing protein [Mycotypha africana]|uniref:adaptin N terminal region-domain-containing protein n=1 Tax=Mycotypha africana TaxID=64632 RepID=UPI002301C10E|nr:adaptin N terminal region-domain-containing protein [Mycotypha africana]KAI8988004.1 adaptin N terminal region-domain-containing protein [Mycotypha africana]